MTKTLTWVRARRKALTAGATALIIAVAAGEGVDLEYTVVGAFVSGVLTFFVPNVPAE